MSPVIEQAARALCRLDGNPENATLDGKPMWRDYLPEARAVLHAIRQPSARMVQAGEAVENKNRWADEVWQAMIAAALDESE